ncbi:hypothetical protein NDA04_03945 [Trichocoleus sp. AS-A2]
MFRNLGCTSNSGKRNPFQQQSVNEFPCGLVNHFFGRMLDELSSTAMAFEPLFTVVDATIFDRLSRCTSGDRRA